MNPGTNMAPCGVKVCRICFTMDCELLHLHENMNLYKGYEAVTGLMLAGEEGLPPYMCTTCADQQMNFVRFMNKSLEAHSKLLDILKNQGHISIESIQAVIRTANCDSDIEPVDNEIFGDVDNEDISSNVKAEPLNETETAMCVDLSDNEVAVPSVTETNVMEYVFEASDNDNVGDSELETDEDIECDFEADNNVGNVQLPRKVFRKQVDDLNDDCVKDIEKLDAEADLALLSMANPDGEELVFRWRSDITNFQGVREEFTGPSGPTFAVTGLTPLDIFKKIWDDDIMYLITRETNRYARKMKVASSSKLSSRMSQWKETTEEEIWKYFAISMLQSLVINNVEREYWQPLNEQTRIGAFDKIMLYSRYTLLKKCLHFVNDAVLPENPSKIDEIMPIIRNLNEKFMTLYLPGQTVAIDESLLGKGRRSFARLIATKAKVGVKSYELCETKTGYLWRMEVQAEKWQESAPSKIAYDLMKPLFGRGHTLVMDNSYNSPLLSKFLKRTQTDTMGTLRLHREFVPETLKLSGERMRVGEVCFRTTEDLNVIVWKDKTPVSMISTFHRPEVAAKENHGYFKPKVVVDYNLAMAGLDHKEKMLHDCPIERDGNICWYKKLFRRLLNESVHNAMVIFNHDRAQVNQLGNREFRLRLVEEIMLMHCPGTLKKPETLLPVKTWQLHLPEKNLRSLRCKFCCENKMQRRTIWKCGTCKVNLCLRDCYTAYHAKFVCQ